MASSLLVSSVILICCSGWGCGIHEVAALLLATAVATSSTAVTTDVTRVLY